FFYSSRRRHTRFSRDWSSDVCSSDLLREENEITEAKAENIVVSTGAKHSIANVFMCMINEGDEVVIFSPYWVSYAEIIKLAGGRSEERRVGKEGRCRGAAERDERDAR